MTIPLLPCEHRPQSPAVIVFIGYALQCSKLLPIILTTCIHIPANPNYSWSMLALIIKDEICSCCSLKPPAEDG